MTKPRHEMAVLGGRGFIGGHLLDALERDGRAARVLTRGHGVARAGMVEIAGSLEDEASLARLIAPGATVVNLAWSGVAAPADAKRQARSLARACRAGGARRLIHCSSVAVMGGHHALADIDDEVPARPANDYGHAKLAVEHTLIEELDGQMPLVIMRPTSVFGPGGLSLVRMSQSLLYGSRHANYVKSCLFGARLFHLVPVESVVRAILHLDAIDGQGTSNYLVSADDDPDSRYRDLEQLLMQAFGLPDYAWPRPEMPASAVALLLRAVGRAHGLSFTRVHGRALAATGFTHPLTLAEAVPPFAAWLTAHQAGRQRVPGA